MPQAVLNKVGVLGSGGGSTVPTGQLWGCRVAGPGLSDPKGPGRPGDLGPAPQLPERGA